MTLSRPMLTASRVPAALVDDYDVARTLTDLALEEAKVIVDNAKAEAKAHLDAAHAKADQTMKTAVVSYEAALAKAIEEADRSVRADMVVTAMKDVADIKKSYSQSEMWLQELVMTSVTAVIGSMPEGEAQLAAIQSGIKSFGSRWGLTLRAPTKSLSELKALVSAYPDVFAVVNGVEGDDLLPDGALYLCGDGGGLEVGISARISALSAALAEEASRHV